MGLSAKSFRFRAVHDYNLFPVQIKEVTSSDLFKKSANKWIMEIFLLFEKLDESHPLHIYWVEVYANILSTI